MVPARCGGLCAQSEGPCRPLHMPTASMCDGRENRLANLGTSPGCERSDSETDGNAGGQRWSEFIYSYQNVIQSKNGLNGL